MIRSSKRWGMFTPPNHHQCWIRLCTWIWCQHRQGRAPHAILHWFLTRGQVHTWVWIWLRKKGTGLHIHVEEVSEKGTGPHTISNTAQKRGQVCTWCWAGIRKGDRSTHDLPEVQPGLWGDEWLSLCWAVAGTKSSEGKKDRAAFGATRDVWYFIGALQCGEPNIRRGFTLCWAHVIAVSINVVSRGRKTSGTNSLECIALAVWCCQAMLPCWHLSTMNSSSEKS